MNIFVLHRDPKIAAQMHIDKHVTKMSIEYAQLLSSAHHAWLHPEDSALVGLYKPTHKNHPATVWVRSHPLHYAWLYELACATWDEYTYRYGKVHASSRLRTQLARVPKMYGCGAETPPPQCMPDLYKVAGNSWDATVDGYRNYYQFVKVSFATWKVRPMPEWWPHTSVSA
jgi:hypothetical protein